MCARCGAASADGRYYAPYAKPKTIYSSWTTYYNRKYLPGVKLLSLNGNISGRVKYSGADKWEQFLCAKVHGKRDVDYCSNKCHSYLDKLGIKNQLQFFLELVWDNAHNIFNSLFLNLIDSPILLFILKCTWLVSLSLAYPFSCVRLISYIFKDVLLKFP